MIYFARVDITEIRINYPETADWEIPRRRPPRLVYYIKIGKSNNPRKRVQELYGVTWRKFTLLATMPGDLAEEKAMHERFAHLRLAREPRCPPPEWFHPTHELMAFIASIQKSQENLPAVS